MIFKISGRCLESFNRIKFTSIIIASFLLIPNVRGDVLAQKSGNVSLGELGIGTSLYFSIQNGGAPLSSPYNISLFQFQISDVGSTYIVDSTNNPDFIANLTNGVKDRISLDYSPISAKNYGNDASSESTFFDSYPTAWNGIDFQGYNVDYLSVTLNSLTISSPGSNPSGDGNWTDCSFSYTLTVIGSVPEPSPLSLLIPSICLVSYLCLSSRRSKRGY